MTETIEPIPEKLEVESLERREQDPEGWGVTRWLTWNSESTELAMPEHSSAVHGDLDRVPGVQNWIERLPAPMRAAWKKSWIYRTAKHLVADAAMTISRAIAVAVNAAEHGCETGDLNFKGVQQVNAASRAEMCAAATLWKAMKAASGNKAMEEEDFDPKKFQLPGNIGQITLKEDYFGELPEDSAFIEEVFGLEVPSEEEIDQLLSEEAVQKAILSAFRFNEGPHENDSINVELVAATVDSAGRVWRQSDHPRGRGGTFATSGGSQEKQDPAQAIKAIIQQAELGKLNKYRAIILQAAVGAANSGQINPAHLKQIPPELQDAAVDAVSQILTHAGFSQGQGRNMNEVIYQLPYELSEPEKVGNTRWRKHLLPLNKVIKHGGETLEFSKEVLTDMINSWKDKAYDTVYATVGHTTDADKGRGILANLFLKEDGDPDNDGLYGDFDLSTEGEKILENNLHQIHTSVAYKPVRYREADDRTFKNAVQHVAFTPTPAVPGVNPSWELVQMSSEDATVVDLTGAHYEPHNQGKESDPVSDVVVEKTETNEEEVEMTEKVEPNVVSLEEFEEVKRELSERKAREEAIVQDAAKAQKTLRRQGIRKMLNESYVAKGVPPAKADAAFTLLSTDEGMVELSEDGDATTTEKAEAIVELLEGYKGSIEFGEKGTSETGEDLDPEERLDKRARELSAEKSLTYDKAFELALEEVK